MRSRAWETRTEDAGVGFPIDQALVERLLFLVDPHHIVGVGELREMRIVGREPGDAAEIDAILMLEDSARPGAGGLGVGADGDTPAFEVLRGKRLAAVHV